LPGKEKKKQIETEAETKRTSPLFALLLPLIIIILSLLQLFS
jgi:hypothetical protein